MVVLPEMFANLHQFVPLRPFDGVTEALNFDTADCHVEGACELYTTKATRDDKKLYKDIEKKLESQHASDLAFTATIQPSEHRAYGIDLSRASPFGPFTEIANRRAFTYVIATLNSSHSDYDFSLVLRPFDFERVSHLRSVMGVIDDALYTLRPRPPNALLATPSSMAGKNSINMSHTSSGNHTWGPKMWKAIDKEMDLASCELYKWDPQNDPFDGEEAAVWNHDYILYNRQRKRMCYLYVRGYSSLSHSPPEAWSAPRPRSKRSRPQSQSSFTMGDAGASKRAKYWFGDRVGDLEKRDDDVIPDPGDDEVDADEYLDVGSGGSWAPFDETSDYDHYDEDDEVELNLRKKISR